MKRNLKLSMLVLVLLLAVGFAAVSTTLIINGTANFGTNNDDFDVIFTKSVIDGVDMTDTTISEDGKSITFTTSELAKVGDKSTLNFVVTNNSTQYDANVTMECIAEDEKNEYYTITNTIPSVIKSKSIVNGTVTATLKKVSIEEITETFTCTITASAVERTTTEATKTISLVYDENNDNNADVGDMIAIGTEEFYVLSNDGTDIRMLSKLNVDYNTNLQSASAPLPAFGTSNNYEGSYVETYLNNYVDYLNTEYELNATGETMTTSELKNLGCSPQPFIGGGTRLMCSTSDYKWLYNVPYWLNNVNHMNINSMVDSTVYVHSGTYGVRPIITLSASLLA